jgi:hypothetical protein
MSKPRGVPEQFWRGKIKQICTAGGTLRESCTLTSAFNDFRPQLAVKHPVG